MKHTTITTKHNYDSHTTVREEVYTEKLKSVEIRTEKRILTTDPTLLPDAISCLDVFKKHETDELVLKLKRYRDGEIKITKTWMVKRESL